MLITLMSLILFFAQQGRYGRPPNSRRWKGCP